MAGMKISELDFVRLLPVFMRDDAAVQAFSQAMNELLGEPGRRLSTIRTWDKIDDLNEAECDELAWELDIDWYDPAEMSLSEKRDTIKVAQQIKRKRGTKWAVERLITAYFGEGYITEWYETGDDPYTFKVLTTNTHVTDENYIKFVNAANAAKNERSHIAGIFYFWQQDPGVECALGTSLHRYGFEKCGTHDRIATVGIIMKPSVESEPEEKTHLYGFTKAGEDTCGTYPQAGTVGALQNVRIVAEQASEHTLYALPESGVVRAAVVGSAVVGSTALVSSSSYPKCGEHGYKATVGAAIVDTAIAGRAIATDE